MASRNKKPPRAGWLEKKLKKKEQERIQSMADETKTKFLRIPDDIAMVDPETGEPIGSFSDRALTEKVHAALVADLNRFVEAGAAKGADADAIQAASNAAAELRRLGSWGQWIFTWRTYVLRILNDDAYVKDGMESIDDAERIKAVLLQPAGTIVNPTVADLERFVAAAKNGPKERTERGENRGSLLRVGRQFVAQLMPYYRALTASAFVKDTRAELEPPPAPTPLPVAPAVVEPVPQTSANGVAPAAAPAA